MKSIFGPTNAMWGHWGGSFAGTVTANNRNYFKE